jgi:hypothetical protein
MAAWLLYTSGIYTLYALKWARVGNISLEKTSIGDSNNSKKQKEQ